MRSEEFVILRGRMKLIESFISILRILDHIALRSRRPGIYIHCNPLRCCIMSFQRRRNCALELPLQGFDLRAADSPPGSRSLAWNFLVGGC